VSDDSDKVVEITEKAWTPEFTLQRILNFVDLIEDVAVVMRLKDGTIETATSIMKPEILALLSKKLDLRLDDFLLAQEDVYEE
jgi:hypothetical protein